MPWWVLGMMLLGFPGTATAQCVSGPHRQIHGSVTSLDGRPLRDVVVSVPETDCTALTDPAGHYSFLGPTDAIQVITEYIGYPTRRKAVPAGVEPIRLDFALDPYPQRIRDWSRLDRRPPTPTEIDGIAGCYWIGVRGAWPEIIELKSDGSVPEIHRYVHAVLSVPANESADAPRGRWRRSSHPNGVLVEVGRGPTSALMFELDLTPEVDWSAIPAVLYHLGNLRLPGVFDSFVTRVECPEG